jgi:hypothetical protein
MRHTRIFALAAVLLWALYFFFVFETRAAVNNARIMGVTPTQIILYFEKSGPGAATLEVSESASYSPVIYDVDATKFSASNQDTGRASCVIDGRAVTCVIGARIPALASDGKVYSRAGRADTLHYIRITGPDASTATLTARTALPILSAAPHDPMVMDTRTAATNKGRALWISPQYSVDAEVIDPPTGITLHTWAIPGDIKDQFGPSALANCYQGTNWTLNACGAVGAGGSTYAGTTQDWLALGFPSIPMDGSGGFRGDFIADRWGTNTIWPRWLKLTADIWFTGTDLTAPDRAVEICWGRDDLACTGTVATVTAGTVQASVSVANAAGTSTTTDGDFWGPEMREPNIVKWSDGKIYNSAASTTVNFRDANDCKRLKVNMGIFVNTGAGITQIVPSAFNCAGTPPTATVGSAIDLTPPTPGPTEGWPFYHNYGLVRNQSFSFQIRKKSTTANNTLHVANAQYSIGGGGSANNSSTGEYTVCSGESKLSTAGYMHCMDLVGRTFAVHPTTGASIFLGTPVGDTDGTGRAVRGTQPVFWEDANNWWSLSGVTGGGNSIFKWTLNAGAQSDTLVTSTDGGAESWWYDATNLNMLGTNKIGDLITTFDSAFDNALFGSCGATSYSLSRYIHGVCRMGQQDTYAWVWTYDLNNKLALGSGGNGAIVAAMKTYDSATKVAWGVVHASHITLDTARAAHQNTVAKEDIGAPGNQKFYGTYNAYWNGTTWVSASPPQQSSVRMRFTSTWNGAWGTAPGAFQSGDPLAPNYAPHWLQKLAVGNQIFVNLGAEHLEITAINGQDANGLDVNVTRNACSGDTYQAINVSDALNVQLRCDTLDFWWDWQNGIHGADSSIKKLNLPGGGHQTDGRYYNLGTPELGWHACDIDTNAACFPMDVTNRTQIIQRSEPPFAGKTAPIFGSCHEGHPGFYPEAGGGLQRALDIHPFICGYTTYTVTWVTGDLFKFTNPAGSPAYPLQRKHYATMISMGNQRGAKDVSGPSSAIDGTSASAWTFCVVDVTAGECRSGSLVGDIYVNYPGFGSKSTMCSASSITEDDLCIEDMASQAASIGMYVLTGMNNQAANIAVYKNREWLPLVQSTNLYVGKGHANTSNIKMLSLNWGFFGQYLVKLPRSWKLDSVNRGSFVPIPVRLGSVPATTNNVQIRFGYQDLNNSGLSFPPCTSRQEACLATGSTVSEATPFAWASAAPAGLACSSNCTVAIPALPGRVVQYQVIYRNVSNATIATGPVQFVAVP